MSLKYERSSQVLSDQAMRCTLPQLYASSARFSLSVSAPSSSSLSSSSSSAPSSLSPSAPSPGPTAPEAGAGGPEVGTSGPGAGPSLLLEVSNPQP